MGRRKPAPPGALKRFTELAASEWESDRCLLWPYGTGGHGYGIIKLDGQYHHTADMVSDATAPKGERHGMARLTEAQVLAIRSDARPHAAVAPDYGVSAAHVKSIRLRRVWKDL